MESGPGAADAAGLIANYLTVLINQSERGHICAVTADVAQSRHSFPFCRNQVQIVRNNWPVT